MVGRGVGWKGVRWKGVLGPYQLKKCWGSVPNYILYGVGTGRYGQT